MQVANTMATKIALDTVSAAGSLRGLTSAVSAATNAWKAQEAALRSVGDNTGAAKAKFEGLGEVIERQKSKIAELEDRQKGLNTENKQDAETYLKLQKQIDSANRVMESYSAQQKRAEESVKLHESGILALNDKMRISESATNAYVQRLKAEGNETKSNAAKLTGYKNSLVSLNELMGKETSELSRLKSEQGESSEAYKKQATRVDELGTRIAETRTKTSKLQQTIDKVNPTGFNKLDRGIDKVKNKASTMNEKINSGFSKMKNAAVSASYGIVSIGAVAVSGAKKASELQNSYKQTFNLMITGGEKAAEAQKNVNKMQSDGAKYSVQYGVSQSKIADGYQELIKRGYSSSQALGSLKSMLQASKASGDDFTDVVHNSTATLESFGMKADSVSAMTKNSSKVVNEMAFAADKTSTDFASLGTAIEYVGSAAYNSGLKMSETSAAIGILSNNGLEAQKAGTGLRKVMQSIQNPTAAASDALKKIGVSTKDFVGSNGKMKSMTDIFKELNDHTAKMSSFQKGQLFNTLFGATGQQAGTILANNADQLGKLNDQVEKSSKNNYVENLAKKNQGTVKNQLATFKESFNAATIMIGKQLLPVLSKASTGMAKAFNSKDGQKGLKVLASGIAGLVKGLVGFIEILGKHTTAVKIFGAALLGAFTSVKLLKGMTSLIGLGRKLVFKPMVDAATGEKQLTMFGKAVKGTGKGIAKAVTWTAKLAWNGAKGAASLLWKSMKGTGKLIGGALKWTAKMSVKAAKAAMKGLLFTAKVTGKGLKLAFNFLKDNPFILIISAIAAVVVALVELYKHNKKFRSFVNGLAKDAKKFIEPIAKFFKNLGKSISDVFGKFGGWAKKGWSGIKKASSDGIKNDEKAWNNFKTNTSKASSQMWKSTKNAFKNGWGSVKTATNSGIKGVEKIWNNLHSATGKIAKEMMKEHPKTFKDGYRAMQSYSNTWKDVTGGHWNRLGKDTERTTKDMTKYWKDVMGDTYDWLNDKTGGRLGDMLKTFQGVLKSISKVWSDAWNGMKNVFGDIWDSIKSLGKSAMNGVIGFMNGGIGGIDKVIDFFGGKKTAIPKIAKLAAGTTNGRLNRDTLAVLNDGHDSPETGNREMVQKKDGSMYLVKGKDTLARLEVGDAVYSAKQTKAMLLGSIPHFGLGSFASSIGSAVSGAVDWAGDKLGDIGSYLGDKFKAIEKFFKNPVSEVTKVFDKAVGSLSGKADLLKDMVPAGGHYMIKQGEKWFKNLFKGLRGSMENPGGSGTARWKSVIKAVADRMGVKLSSAGMAAILKRIAQESNGSPTVTNNWDSNAKAGHPSTGLLQYIQPTFDHWLPKRFTNDIHNGSSQIAAMFNDSNWLRDISVSGGWGPTGHKRMANGGIISTHQMVEMAEGSKPEMVIPLDMNKRSRATQLLAQVMGKFVGDSTASDSSSDSGLSKKLDTLNDNIESMVGMLGQLLGLTVNQTKTIQNTAFNKDSLYRQQGRDQALRDYQTY